MYTVIDLLEKLIQIEEEASNFYREAALVDGLEENVKILARVFEKEEKRHCELYKKLREENLGNEGTDIDFSIYDKASQLIFEFKKLISNRKVNDLKSLMEISLRFEKENLALVLSIRGVFVRSKNDVESKNYEVLSKVIIEEQKHVNNIQRLSN